MLLDFAQNQIFDFVPSRKDGGANDQHHKLGPFVLGGRKTEATDGDLDNFRLMVQDLRCEPGNNLTEIRTARVSSVFRLIHSSENIYRAMKRTGLSGTQKEDGALLMASSVCISGGNFYNVSMFFEGLYDSVVGEMYLIGCRDVRSSQKFVYNGTNLEGGMDRLIEVKIKYPPSNLQWLLNPKIKIFINSKRSKEDPLYLSPVSLNTSVVNYSKQLVYVIYRKGFEGVLRILMLRMAIICTRSQSVYTKNEGHPTAYISLVMLGVHTFAYSIPLITGNEVLLKWKEFKPYRTEKYDFEKLQLFQVLDSATNILLLAALWLNLKLFQNVCESRGRQIGDCHIPKAKIPSDKIVFPITLAIHISGFFLFHVIHELCTSQIMVQLGNYYPRGKPLRKSYYLGFTLLRFLLHGYEYARDPVPSPELDDNELQHLDIGSYTKIGNVIMGAIVLILAVIVYIQQKCNYQADSQKVKPEVKELATKSDLYERLFPSD
ncbi:uncharacterized protein LOC114276453 [Camellia sinensis]|uniref:uncharacterized protein LOC114276453 n=1 Tax=Camellia sinensis TaxID=4442 RepID=UPI001035CA62|nr:uncharacterized protein LOC114276453 [Camellia sinensis]